MQDLFCRLLILKHKLPITTTFIDSETDLYYYRERYYSVKLGRFLQTDPIGIDNENTYTYSYNDPVNYVDPYGLRSIAGTLPVVGIGGYETGHVDLGEHIGVDTGAVDIIVPPVTPIPPITPTPGENAPANPKRISEGKTGKKGEKEKSPAGYLTKKAQEKPKKKGKKGKKEETPTTKPGDFENVKGRKAKKNKKTGEIWEKDLKHKDHYEVYKNKKAYGKGQRNRSVWSDGYLKEHF